jgi:hypothetical protein
VTFGRGFGKYQFMKTWVNLCTIVLAVGVMTVMAQTPASTPVNTNEVAAPPPAPAPAPAPVPAPPKVTTPPKVVAPPHAAATVDTSTPASTVTSHPAAVTNPPAPVVEAKPAEEEPATATNTVSTEGEGAAAPPANAGAPTEGSGIGHLSALLVGAVILLLGGGVGFYIWSRSGADAHGSLITSAMNELNKHSGGEDKDEEKPAEKKKMEIKYPPPMG